MIHLTINGKKVSVPEGTTILNAAKKAEIIIPTLCYLAGLNEIGACRVCVVEIEGRDRLSAACSTPAEEGMVVYTDSTRAREARRTNIRLLLSQHDCRCPICVRSGNCALQTLAGELNILDQPYETSYSEGVWDKTVPLIRNESKCIKCMRCIQVCGKLQTVGVWDIANTGSRTTVDISGNRTIRNSECTYCGQCITHCPVGALQARDDCQRVIAAIDDPEIVTVVQVAPAVRSSWAESFGVSRREATPARLAAALRRLGFDYIFDTAFTADLTVMEESEEFIERFTHRDRYSWPMFTSCCPGWVRFLKSQYPAYTQNLSTSKSPQQMFGAVAKSFFAKSRGLDPHKLFCVSVMPCTAKKSECELPTMRDACGDPDVDVVITTREFARLLHQKSIHPTALPEESFDSPLGFGSGAAVVFGATGGVMDAALRSAYFEITGNNPSPDAFKAVRGPQGWKSAVFEVPGVGPVRTAVVSGLGNTRKLMEAIRSGEAEYDFVEVMACPGGCAGGGGQPIRDGKELAAERGSLLWQMDQSAQIRYSHENEDVKALYAQFLGKPLSEKSHELLHTDQNAWQMPPKLDPADK